MQFPHQEHNYCVQFPHEQCNFGSKTSLLDVISGRAEGKVDGVVSYKHHQCKRSMMRQKASYVLQADRLLPTLTVRETLTYMAFMKLPGSLSNEQIEKKVTQRPIFS